MIPQKGFNFSTESEEGKMLLAALAMMTGNPEWSSKTPDTVTNEVINLANQIFYEEEWKSDQIRKKRSDSVDNILS